MAAQPTAARAGRIRPGVATRVAWSLGTVAIVVTLLAMALVVATRSVPRPGWERQWRWCWPRLPGTCRSPSLGRSSPLGDPPTRWDGCCRGSG